MELAISEKKRFNLIESKEELTEIVAASNIIVKTEQDNVPALRRKFSK